MASFYEYGKEIVCFTVDALIFTLALRWHGNNHKAQEALMRPVLKDYKALEEWMQNCSENSWAVLQGYAEPIGPVLHSVTDKNVKGVIQKLTLKEYITARNASGFWQDTDRVVSSTINAVPFGLRVGRSLVQIEDPMSSKLLTLRTIRTEFTQKTPSFTDYIWSFLIGTRQRGVQTTEEMLLCGTKLTGLGTLMRDKVLSSAPSGTLLQPHCLTELTVPELQKQVRYQLRWSSAVLIISGIAGIAIIIHSLKKAYKERKKKWEAAERQKRKYERNRATSTDGPTCIICDNPREVILLPCGHICLCFDCGFKIDGTCPMCRAKVDTINEYYIT
ncbi:hypothetical protein B566_EDAN007917 [Ephemera danica]|nr:hypothetical protein B566_EDAN007917 [Ephemera danica]